jgi:predicted RNA-binding protein with PUA-like domain
VNYWLMKSEPDAFSIDDLAARPQQIEPWDGVRNYQARNMLRDQMQVNDLAFFYHSNCKPPGIVGIVRIVRAGYPDVTAFDPQHKHFDPAGSTRQPRWFMVDVQLVEKFSQLLSLPWLRSCPELAGMQILRPGNRLSVTPVSTEHWNFILAMAKR